MPEISGLDIVRLQPDAWQIYRDLRLAALAQDAFAFGATLERERQHTERDFRIRLEHRATFVARLDNRFVGLAGLLPPDEESETPLLISMWVGPEGRGQGIGAALVNQVLDCAQAEGYDQVRLWVTEGNAPAERLYARTGFVPTGRRQPVRPSEPDNWEIEMAYRFRDDKSAR